jgi:hypothetical protein
MVAHPACSSVQVMAAAKTATPVGPLQDEMRTDGMADAAV